MRCKTSPFRCKASKLSEREMSICPEHGYMFACVCVYFCEYKMCEKVRQQQDAHTNLDESGLCIKAALWP